VKLTIHPHPVLRPRLSGLFFYSLVCTQTTIYHNENHWFLVYIFEIKYGFIKVMCLMLQLTTYPSEPPSCQKISQPANQSVILTHTHSHSILLAHLLLPHSLTDSLTHTLIYSLTQSLLLAHCLKNI